jgi:hypothetical protein
VSGGTRAGGARSHLVRLSLAVAIVLATACAPAPGPAPAPSLSSAFPPNIVDCGSFDSGHNTYDAAGLECFWRAYSAGAPVRWAVKQLTVEGDPVPEAIQYVPGQAIVVTRDVSADTFSSPIDRRVWIYSCTTVTRRPWATDRSRSFFELTGCTGDGPTTAFP